MFLLTDPNEQPIKSIFFYRSFLCFVWQSRWQITCEWYTYPGEGGEKEAVAQVDYFLELRHRKRTDRDGQP
jgi:hypothetical protein